MSYYGSAIATFTAMEVHVLYPIIWNKYYPIPYDMKNRILPLSIIFSAVSFMDSEKIIL
jgi:hypothetical protein